MERIAHCGKVIRDARLMVIAGFNAEEVISAKMKGGAIVDYETLSNHLSRIKPEKMQEVFLDHIAVLRKERWIRGGVYAADAHEIIIKYGRKHEKIGKVGNKHGYKLVIVFIDA